MFFVISPSLGHDFTTHNNLKHQPGSGFHSCKTETCVESFISFAAHVCATTDRMANEIQRGMRTGIISNKTLQEIMLTLRNLSTESVDFLTCFSPDIATTVLVVDAKLKIYTFDYNDYTFGFELSKEENQFTILIPYFLGSK